MGTLHWIACFALLAQVYARAKNLEISGTIAVSDPSGRDDAGQEYTLEALLKDGVSSDGSEYAGKIYNDDDKRFSLEELLADHSDSQTASFETTHAKSCSTATNEELRSNGTERRARILGSTDDVANVNNNYNVLVESTLQNGNMKYCGGALLSTKWVLTAAQCVATAASATVYLGAVADIKNAETVKSSGTNIYVHPGFILNFLFNDIALLKLTSNIKTSTTIGTIKLSTANTNSLNSAILRVFGWGVADDSVTNPDTFDLKYVDLTNVKKNTCLTQTAETYVAYPGNTGCLSTSKGTKNFCNIDPGSPVVYINDADSSEKVVGINSLSLGCPSDYPSSFTLVQPYINWIKTTTKSVLT